MYSKRVLFHLYNFMSMCVSDGAALYGKKRNPLGKVFSNNVFQAGPVYRYNFISMYVSNGAGCSVYCSGTPLLLSSNIKYQLTTPVQTVISQPESPINHVRQRRLDHRFCLHFRRLLILRRTALSWVLCY